MTQLDRLLMLFRAFREKDEEAFNRAADSIIADELTANHHAQARELQKALRINGEIRPATKSAGLAALPKDRRHGDPLVEITQPTIQADRVILEEEAKNHILRLLLEHAERLKLAKYGYAPKSKVLFWGPPGCGKTLTANWIASELHLPLAIVRLDSLITSYLGETASHIQRVFDMARAQPMVLLFDEADALGKERDDRNDVGELKRVVNSLLQAMDSFRATESVVIAATNHQNLLDTALWRRFDDIIYFPGPHPEQVKAFLNCLLNGVTMVGSVEAVVRSTHSLSFAQIENGVTDAIKTMILDDRRELRAADLAGTFKTCKRMLDRAAKKQSTKPRKNE